MGKVSATRGRSCRGSESYREEQVSLPSGWFLCRRALGGRAGGRAAGRVGAGSLARSLGLIRLQGLRWYVSGMGGRYFAVVLLALWSGSVSRL